MAAFKLRSRRFFDDVDKAPAMLAKGKLPLLGARVRGKAGRADLFRRAVTAAAEEAAAAEAFAAKGGES